jgi:hypothetical protein
VRIQNNWVGVIDLKGEWREKRKRHTQFLDLRMNWGYQNSSFLDPPKNAIKSEETHSFWDGLRRGGDL